jgi:hypothetical protein
MEFTASLFVDHTTEKVHRLSIDLVPTEGSHVADSYLVPSGESAFDNVFQALAKQNGRSKVSDALLSAYQTADTQAFCWHLETRCKRGVQSGTTQASVRRVRSLQPLRQAARQPGRKQLAQQWTGDAHEP